MRLMHVRPYQEAFEIFQRVRLGNDPLSLLQDIQHAEILLPQAISGTYGDTELTRLDSEALEKSRLIVPSHPWTTIAGAGLVSSLISAFFETDHNYLIPLIHASSFIHDMRTKADGEAAYCSPTLVNAICALKCVSNL
jgi:hypothetical protein